MYFMHAESIWSLHPGLNAFALAVDNVREMDAHPARRDMLVTKIERRLASGSESEMPEIASWREAFSKMGLKPTQYRCASEALLRRYRKENSMPSFHPLVDYLNFVSMSFAIPIAAFDCEKVVDGIVVRLAEGSETYETFRGDSEYPQANETIFSDPAGHAHARRWTHRQSARSIVTSNTERVLIVAEGLHVAADRDLRALEDELRSGLTEASVRLIGSMQIRATERRFEF